VEKQNINELQNIILIIRYIKQTFGISFDPTLLI